MVPEDIVNNALDVIGHPTRINGFWDGTYEALVARDMWIQVRDAKLTLVQPEWSIWDDPLTAVKHMPSWGYDEQTPWTTEFPDMPWRYEYPLPANCLVPLALKPRQYTLPLWRPRPMGFRVKTANGVYTILGNDPAPVLSCVHSVPDTTVWEEDFIDLIIVELAQRLAPLFGKVAPRQAPRPQEGATNANTPG